MSEVAEDIRNKPCHMKSAANLLNVNKYSLRKKQKITIAGTWKSLLHFHDSSPVDNGV